MLGSETQNSKVVISVDDRSGEIAEAVAETSRTTLVVGIFLHLFTREVWTIRPELEKWRKGVNALQTSAGESDGVELTPANALGSIL